MEYTASQICTDVRRVMDRNETSAQETLLTEDNNTLTLDDLITDCVLRAARVTLLNAPLKLVGEGKTLDTDIHWESQPGFGMGFTMLPDDFLRLVTFQMTDWERPAVNTITAEDTLYSQQRSRYPGMRGCPQRPIVAVVSYPAGMALELFSCRGGEKVAVRRAQYLSEPTFDKNNKIELPTKCYDCIVYLTASLVCGVLKDNDLSVALGNTAKELLQ